MKALKIILTLAAVVAYNTALAAASVVTESAEAPVATESNSAPESPENAQPASAPVASQDAAPGTYERISAEAEQGSANAQWVLGYMYMLGDEVAANPQTAASWFKKAADQGMVRAQQTMGMLYYWGHGVQQDYQKSARWYSKGARSGDPESQLTIGKMYISGIGVDQNSTTALNWLELASAKRLEAHYWIAVIYHDGIGTEQDLRQAAIHYQAAADAGHELAQSVIGRFYYLGMGVQKDHAIAASYLEKAAAAELADAQFLLGRIYMSGEGVKKDYTRALELFAAATESNQLDQEMQRLSYLLTGNIYLQKKELKAAYKWFDMAAQEGTRDYIVRVKRVRNIIAVKAKIKIETKLVPMEGSGLIALYEGQLFEYDPVLSDFGDPYVEASASLPNVDWWAEMQPNMAYSYADMLNLETTQLSRTMPVTDAIEPAGS